jgi:hypothetical protein
MVRKLLNTGQFIVKGDTLYYRRVIWIPLAIIENGLPIAIYLDMRSLPGLKKMSKLMDLKGIPFIPLALSDPGNREDHTDLVRGMLDCYLRPEVYEFIENSGLTVLDTLVPVVFEKDVDVTLIISELMDKWTRRRYMSSGKNEHDYAVSVYEKLEGFGLRLKILEYYYVKNKGMFGDYKYVW